MNKEVKKYLEEINASFDLPTLTYYFYRESDGKKVKITSALLEGGYDQDISNDGASVSKPFYVPPITLKKLKEAVNTL